MCEYNITFSVFSYATRIKKGVGLCQVLHRRPAKARSKNTRHKEPTPVACGVHKSLFPRAAGRRPGDPWERLCVFAPNNENLAVFCGTKLQFALSAESLPKSSIKILSGQTMRRYFFYLLWRPFVIIQSKQHTGYPWYVP